MSPVPFAASSPLGPLVGECSASGLHTLRFASEDHELSPERFTAPAIAAEAVAAIEAYFAGDLSAFDEMAIDAHGTDFQTRVWAELVRVPAGETRSYSDIATTMGRPNATRAVGAANGQNPIALAIPCHRVIGASGELTGYAHGLWRKRWLLEHEGAALSSQLGLDLSGPKTRPITPP